MLGEINIQEKMRFEDINNSEMSSRFPSAFDCYRPRSQKVFGVILISENKNVLLVKGRKTEKWSFPKGHIRPTESWSQCASRECYEETGINIDTTITTQRPTKLFSGYYYVYNNVPETTPYTNDSSEVMDVAWIPLDKIQHLRKNADVNNFLQYQSKILTI